jgi:hypothetical protein
MSRRPATFTQARVARAIRAAEQVAPGRRVVEVTPDGVIRIVPLNMFLGASRYVHEKPEDDPFACGLESVP